MKKIPLLSVGCAILALSACDHYSEQLAAMDTAQQNITQISPAAGGEMPFSGYLKSEYMYLARYEQDQYDYKAAKYYTKKAHTLSGGALVAPGSIKEFEISSARAEELNRARGNLINALKVYNVPENRYALAMAQTRYDCWLDQEEESAENNDVITCKNEFRHSMASLIPPEGQDIRFSIPFDEGSMALSEEARISLQRALSFWETNHERGYKMLLSPTSNVSEEQSNRQISMVRSILQFNGVSAFEIGVMTQGAQSEISQFEIRIQRLTLEDSKQSEI